MYVCVWVGILYVYCYRNQPHDQNVFNASQTLCYYYYYGCYLL